MTRSDVETPIQGRDRDAAEREDEVGGERGGTNGGPNPDRLPSRSRLGWRAFVLVLGAAVAYVVGPFIGFTT